MLHSGRTPVLLGRCVRETGIGPEEGIAYQLDSRSEPARSVALTFAGNARDRLRAAVRIGRAIHPVDLPPPTGFVKVTFPVPGAESPVPVALWSTSPRPLIVAQIELTTTFPAG